MTQPSAQNLTKPCIQLMVTEKERNLILQIRDTLHGRLEVYIKDAQPDRVDKWRESIKL